MGSPASVLTTFVTFRLESHVFSRERVAQGRLKPSHLSLQWSHVPDLVFENGHGKSIVCY
jgi:hypothetical protein